MLVSMLPHVVAFVLLQIFCCKCLAEIFGVIDDVSVNAGLDRELSPEAIRSQGEAHEGC